MHEDEFVRVQQVMRDDQAADRVLGDHAAGIADDVRLAGLQSKQVLDVEPRVHAPHHGDTPRRLDGLLAGIGRPVHGFAAGVAGVVVEELVGIGLGHGGLPVIG